MEEFLANFLISLETWLFVSDELFSWSCPEDVSHSETFSLTGTDLQIPYKASNGFIWTTRQKAS